MKSYNNLLFFLICILLCIFGLNSDTMNDDYRQAKANEKSHQVDSLNLLIFVCLLIMTVLTIWLFKHVRLRFVHETGLAIIYGLAVGAIIKYISMPNVSPIIPFINQTIDFNQSNMTSAENLLSTSSSSILEPLKDTSNLDEKATFDPEIFFNVLLPPIIFHAGYSMKKKHFFKNFGAIASYAFFGTIISCFVIGGMMFGFLKLIGQHWMFTTCLRFGAIISATDPVTVLAIFADLNVDVNLYALIFGESILNDAVAIVLVSTIDTYRSEKTGFDGLAVIRSLLDFLRVYFGAFALGSGMACITALLTKYTHVRDYPLLETSLFFTMSYCTFLAAEAVKMTGIVAVLFCGICQAHYTYNNLSVESKTRTKQVFELLNFLTENFVFAYIGVATFTFNRHSWNIPFILMSFLAIIVGRACHVYPLSFLLNLGRSNKIMLNFQHFIMFSGLRGAMAFALSIRDTSSVEDRTIFSTTLIIVITTVVLSGGCITQMLHWLKIQVSCPEIQDTNHNQPLQNSESELHDHAQEKARLFRWWYLLDAKFVKPLLTHACPPLTETLPNCCQPLARLLTTEQQRHQSSLVEGERAEDSDIDLADIDEINSELHNSGNLRSSYDPPIRSTSNQEVLPFLLHENE